jgi:hypothetical protein
VRVAVGYSYKVAEVDSAFTPRLFAITYSITEPVKPPNWSKCLSITNTLTSTIIFIIRTILEYILRASL